jgi:hypothetical protein
MWRAQQALGIDHREATGIESSMFAFFIGELRNRKSKKAMSLCLGNYPLLPEFFLGKKKPSGGRFLNPADDPAYFAALAM